MSNSKNISTNNSAKEKIKKELEILISDGQAILNKFLNKDKELNFYFSYQTWYTSALKVVHLLALDRYSEFRSYYEIDPKRKDLGYGNYVIQDYLKDITPNQYKYPNFDSHGQAAKNFFNQWTILQSLVVRIDDVLSNISEIIYIEFQESELKTAQELLKISTRAAGSLAGVILETYLQKIIIKHNLAISKKHPTIADMNEPLKNHNIIDLTTWRKISYLGDIRNLCSHKKDTEPTKEQVQELIDGVNWAIKNIF